MFPKKKWSNKKVNKAPESLLQAQCEHIAKLYGVFYIRIPDLVYSIIFGGLCGFISVGIQKKVAKYISGIPDMILLFADGHYKCVELKTKSKLRQNQKLFRKRVGHGNFVKVETVEEFVEVIRKEGAELPPNPDHSTLA